MNPILTGRPSRPAPHGPRDARFLPGAHWSEEEDGASPPTIGCVRSFRGAGDMGITLFGCVGWGWVGVSGAGGGGSVGGCCMPRAKLGKGAVCGAVMAHQRGRKVAPRARFSKPKSHDTCLKMIGPLWGSFWRGGGMSGVRDPLPLPLPFGPPVS